MARLGRGQPNVTRIRRNPAAQVYTKARGTPFVFADTEIDHRDRERWRGRFVLERNPQPSVGGPVTADVSMASTFGMSVDATVDHPADASIPATFGVAAAATVDHPAAASVPLTFGLSADATVDRPAAASLPLSFGLSADASIGAIPEVTGSTAVASSGGTAVTTASLTPVVGEWLVALVTASADAANPVTFTLTDSASGAWTLRTLANSTTTSSGTGPAAAIYTQRVTSATSITVTSTPAVTGTTLAGATIQVYRVALSMPGGALLFAAYGSGFGGNNAAVTASLFSTAFTQSIGFVAAADWWGASTATSSDLTYSSFNSTAYEALHGYKRLGVHDSSSTATLDNGNGGSSGQWTWAAVEIAAVSPALGDGSDYGFAAGGSLPYYGQPELDERIARMAAQGVKYIRFDIGWDVVQAAGSGSFDWSLFDPVVARSLAFGLTPVLILNATAPFARGAYPANPFAAPTDHAAYATFAAAAVTRYAPLGVKHWEVWNEPNLASNWFPTPSAADYTDMLQQAYTAIKGVDATAVVLMGGLARAYTGGSNIATATYVSGIYSAGGAGYFDAANVHVYTYPVTADSGDGLNISNVIPTIRSAMVANGDTAKKIWITEAGAPTNGPGALGTVGHVSGLDESSHVDEGLQAQIIASLIRAREADSFYGPMFLYTDIDTGSNPATDTEYYGAFYGDASPKPSAALFRASITRSGPPPNLNGSAAADVARRLAASSGRIVSVRTEVAAQALAGDVAIGEAFAVTASATRGAVGDVSIASTFGLSTSATRGATADATIASTFALSVSASLGPVGDVAIGEAFAITAAATRGATADVTLGSTFALTSAASVGATAAATVAATLQLDVAADVTTATVPPRPPVNATEAATLRAVDARRAYRPALVVRAPQASPPNIADVTVASTFSLTANAGVGLSGDVALASTLGLSVSAVRGATGGASVPLTFGIAADVSIGPVGSVAIGETFALTSSATRGAVASVAVAETFAITAAATLAGVGASTVASTFGISADATVTRTGGVAPIALSFATSIGAFVTSGSITAASMTGGTAAGPRATAVEPVATGARITSSAPSGARITGG